MKILQVIHGYPMRYNAGSEVYTQTLSQTLAARGHEVHVFTREENSFATDFCLHTEQDPEKEAVTLHIINNPRLRDCYQVEAIDKRFEEVLERTTPDVVHIGHLSHLSTSIIRVAAARGVPVVFTLHDFWLMCPRGQFIQTTPSETSEPWPLCGGQQDQKCATKCYSRYFSGSREEHASDLSYWTDWVGRRMRHVREMSDLVNLFIAPSRHIYQRYTQEFNIPAQKIVYLDYGFVRNRFINRKRIQGEPFTFGYIGTHIPAKGVHHLIQAFGQMKNKTQLKIWGRDRGQDTAALKLIARQSPACNTERIKWMGEYRNQDIVKDAFNCVDAIVVPSIWEENSPLVIHEAQQARVPVITADCGGMAEYVHHEVNGLLYPHRSVAGLARQMDRLASSPQLVQELGARGYLYSSDADIISAEHHAGEVEKLYERVISQMARSHPSSAKGPWRITFDTNPDTCNLRCIMCEEHSPHSKLQQIRKHEARPRRIMSFDVIERVVNEAVPHGLREIIPSTMGEPLLYDDFEKIIALCKRQHIKLNLTTNGTFPRIGAHAWAEKIVPVGSDVKISWNGATARTHESIMLGTRWQQVLENIRAFIAVRDSMSGTNSDYCSVTLQLTFLESNVHELSDIVRLAIELGADRVKGHHLWAHFPQIKEQSMRRNPASIQRWNKAVQDAQKVASQVRLANGKPIRLDNIFPLNEGAERDLAPGGQCPFLGQEAWVSAQGRFDPCCAPDAERRSLGEFGNLHTSGIMEIWDSPTYQKLIHAYRGHKLCQSCNMRKPIDAQV